MWLLTGVSGCWDSAEHCSDEREEGGSAGAAHSDRLYVDIGVLIGVVVESYVGVRFRDSEVSR